MSFLFALSVVWFMLSRDTATVATFSSVGRKDVAVRSHALLRKIVVQIAEARQILRHEAMLAAGAVARERRVIRWLNCVIDPQRSLVGVVDSRSAHPDSCWSRCPSPTTVGCPIIVMPPHAHHQVRLRHILRQHRHRDRIHAVGGNLVVRKWLPGELRIRRADRKTRVVVGIRHRRVRVVDRHAAHAEVAFNLVRRRHCLRHAVRLHMAQAFIVHEEERVLLRADGSAERAAKVVLHQVVRSAHIVERVRIHRAIAQKLVGGAVQVTACPSA